MRDVLEYTEEELRSMNKEQLKQLLIEAGNKESLYNTRQLVEKTLINSLYGALANKWFPLFNEDMAAAITGNGRYSIQKSANYVEEGLQKLIKSPKPYIVYGDTDSCVGDTLIETNNGQIKIEDLFEMCSGRIDVLGEDNFVKHINTSIKAASVSANKELQYNNIKYVMKHRVKKRMYKIKCNGNEVVITADHSIIVLRNDELLSVKPNDILKTDKLIKII